LGISVSGFSVLGFLFLGVIFLNFRLFFHSVTLKFIKQRGLPLDYTKVFAVT